MFSRKRNYLNRIFTNKIFENFAALSALQAMNYLLPLITVPYTSRVLGPEYFGVLGIANSLNAWLLIIADYGFQMSATPEIARCREDKNELNKIYSSIIYARALLLLFSSLLLLFIVNVFYQQYKLIFLLNFGFVVGQILFPIWFFQGMEEMKYITFINSGIRVFFVVMIFLCLKTKSDILAIPVLNSTGAILGGLVSLFIVKYRFRIKLVTPHIKEIISQIRKSSSFFLSRVSVSVYTSSTAMFLSFIAQPTLIGYYSAAEKLYSAIQMIYSPISTAIYPYMARTADTVKYKKIIRLVSCIFYPCLVIVFIFAPKIVSLIFGADFDQSIAFFRWFCLVAGVVFLSQLIGYPLFAGFKKEKIANQTVIIGSIFHFIGLLLLWIKVIPPTAVVIVILSTESIIFGQRLYYARKLKLL